MESNAKQCNALNIISRAVNAWRIRLWRRKGQQCPCKCGMRIPFIIMKIIDGFKYSRPCKYYIYTNEFFVKWYKFSLDEFRCYLRKVNYIYYPDLLRFCIEEKDERWLICLFQETPRETWKGADVYKPDVFISQLLGRNYFRAARIAYFTPRKNFFDDIPEEDFLEMVKPYGKFSPKDWSPLRMLNHKQRLWLLNHPELKEKTSTARAYKHWLAVSVWMKIKKGISFWKAQRTTLLEPKITNFDKLLNTLINIKYVCSPGTPLYRDTISWADYLIQHYPGNMKAFLCSLKYSNEWLLDIIDRTIAFGNRIMVLRRLIWKFKNNKLKEVKTKLLEWLNDPNFANIRVARDLMWIATRIINFYIDKGKCALEISQALEHSIVVDATIKYNAVWFSQLLSENSLLYLTRKKFETPVSVALRDTPRFRKLQIFKKFKGSVYLMLFFNKHIYTRITKKADCPICWKSDCLLTPLHGDLRHGICGICKRELQINFMLNKCPICRVDL